MTETVTGPKSITRTIPSFEEVWEALPDEAKAGAGEDLQERLEHAYNDRVRAMEAHARWGQGDVTIWMEPAFRIANGYFGPQYILEWGVTDAAMAYDPRAINFHFQNTSQCLTMGCILVSGGDVSIHT